MRCLFYVQQRAADLRTRRDDSRIMPGTVRPMHKRHIARHVASSTPSAFTTTAGNRALPDDLLREASQRLGIISLLGAVLWIVATVLDHIAVSLLSHGAHGFLHRQPTDAIAAVSIVVSLGFFFYSRSTEQSPQVVLDLGLVYMVFTALALGLLLHCEPVPSNWPINPMISWIGVVTLMFAAIVPSTPMRTLIAGLVAVSMNPVGMLIARARGAWDFGPTSSVLLMHYPDYILVGVAVVISHVLTNLGRKVAKARDLGAYHLGELLGRGGMGEVYKATHHMLARPAAIKLIRPEMIRAEHGEAAQIAVQRFRREAEAAANLRSPHTVELYDFGITDDETLYFVMELLDGMDLQTLVREHGPVPANRVIYILRQLCASLEEAHARGLVHRDIKPANIHLGRLGLQHDFVKVLDFGLVKSIVGAKSGQSLATAAGLTPGTPAFMAPEMALGETVDARTDIYAVGCVAYYLLTGALVFDAESVFQMVAMILRDEPVPPSKRTQSHVPPALEQIVLACLAKNRNERPRGAAELSRALAAVDAPAWDEEQAREWWNAHPTEETLVSFPGLFSDSEGMAATVVR
jgi:serine/threonine protein kinase